MQKHLYALVISLVWFTGISAFCGNAKGEETIAAEEYEIFGKALATQGPGPVVHPETMATVKAGADWLKPPVGLHLSADMIHAFNENNIIAYKLTDDFCAKASGNDEHSLTDKKKLRLSRPGFDRQMRRALVIMAMVYYYPEDVMNEGIYVLLEKKEDQWQVVGTAKAWDMRLGPTP